MRSLVAFFAIADKHFAPAALGGVIDGALISGQVWAVAPDARQKTAMPATASEIRDFILLITPSGIELLLLATLARDNTCCQ